jgi:hypothetical protein
MTQELITAEQQANALSLIADANDDFAGMRKRDFILPRANILQALSPDVVDGRAPAGTVMDSSTKAAIIQPRQEGKYVVPMLFWFEWIEWNKQRNVDKDERIVARSVDPKSELAKRAEAWETFVNSEGREVCVVTEYFNFIVAIVDDQTNDYDNIYLTGFARSSHRAGKMWLNRMHKTKIDIGGQYVRPSMWAMRWAYKTELVRKDNFAFYVPVIGDGKQNPLADWARLKTIADEFKARKAEIMERNTNKEDTGVAEAAPVTPNTEM